MKPADNDGRPPPASATPSAPEVARRVFRSERLPLAQRYADLLATEGVVRGLIGPRERIGKHPPRHVGCGGCFT